MQSFHNLFSDFGNKNIIETYLKKLPNNISVCWHYGDTY